VFDQFNGLPMHPLLVHAGVVFVPLLAIAAVVYALVPKLRARVGWVAALLAIGAPGAAFVSMQSGKAFKQSRYGDVADADMPKIITHEGYGELTFWFSLGLGVATGLMLLLTRRPLPKILEVLIIIAVVALAGVAGYFVFRAGDSGAQSVYGS
jgi:hypothetical protein